jgi:hypothetical protein
MTVMSDSDGGRSKTCLDCRQRKPFTEFPPAKKRSDGRASYCRECFGIRSRAAYRRKQERAGRTVRAPRVAPPGLKWCGDCDQVKTLDEFCRNRNEPTGRATYCKDCHNARARESRERLYGGGREYHLKSRYGIGQADVDRMLAEQRGACLGCGKPDPEHVDHDHETGRVRGMLCFNCNQALGNVRDNVEVLNRLGSYLIVRRPDLIRARGTSRRPPDGIVIELADAYPRSA